MVPNIKPLATEVSCGPDTALVSSKEPTDVTAKPPLEYRRQIVWSVLIVHAYMNLAALYGVYLMLTSAKILTGVWGM
jgi:hypothetical protein